MNNKKTIDWESVEKDWRAGIKTKLQMSEEYNVSRAAMDKRFNKLGIDRDLTEKIAQRTQALVTRAEVTQKVTSERLVTTEREIVEINALAQANILISHRAGIARYRDIASKLLLEIETETDNQGSFAELAEVIIWRSGEDGEVQTKDEVARMTKMQALFDRVMSNPSRVDSLKKLAEIMKVLIGLERQAIGLKDDMPPPVTAPTMITNAMSQQEAIQAYEEMIGRR